MPHIGTIRQYLCIVIKNDKDMWFAVLVFVSLSVEILSYITGGDSKNIAGGCMKQISGERK